MLTLLNIGLLLLLLLQLSIAQAEENSKFTLDEDVIILDQQNFEAALKKYEFLMVDFYSPDCARCKTLEPEFQKAAKQLKDNNPPIYLAKVDATVEQQLSQKYIVKQYPKVIFFRKQHLQIEYTDEHMEYSIVQFCKDKIIDKVQEIKDAQELESLIKEKKVILIYFGDSEMDPEFNQYSQAAYQNDLQFYFTFNKDVSKQYITRNNTMVESSVVLFKDFDELRNDLLAKSLNLQEINKFIQKYSFPQLMPLTKRAENYMYDKRINCIILFTDNSEKGQAAENLFKSLVENNKQKIKFVISKSDDGHGTFERMAELIGFSKQQLPLIFIFEFNQGQVKYKFEEDEMTKKTIEKFISNYRIRRLKPYQKSQPEPEVQGHVKTIVAKNWEEMVIKNNQDVLVKFYAPWCELCKEIAPKYEALAKKLEKNKNLILAEIDNTANDIPNISIGNYPTIQFYAAGKKNKPLKYEGEKSEEAIEKWLMEQTTFPWVKDEL